MLYALQNQHETLIATHAMYYCSKTEKVKLLDKIQLTTWEHSTIKGQCYVSGAGHR